MLTETVLRLLPVRDYSYYGSILQVAETIALGYRKAGHMSPHKYSKLSKELFPDKPKGWALYLYLLQQNGYKHCFSCDTTLTTSDFRPNASKSDGLQSHCKGCHQEGTSRTQAARQAKYKAAKLSATPSWADLDAIAEFYYNTPKGHHVDHIVPLQGDLVCGLHTLENLQYLTAEQNISKNNKFSGL